MAGSAYRIARWAELYEPTRRELRRSTGPLKYVKCHVHGGDQSSSYRRLFHQAENAMLGASAFALFVKLLELAANEPLGKRNGTVYWRSRPATVGDIAFYCSFPDELTVACLDLLCDARIAWVERVDTDEAMIPLVMDHERTAAATHDDDDGLRVDHDGSIGGPSSIPRYATSGPGVDHAGSTSGPRGGQNGDNITEPNRTEPVTELNSTEAGTGAMDSRIRSRAGPERRNAWIAILRRPCPTPAAWVQRMVGAIAEATKLPGHTYNAQRGALTVVAEQLAGHPQREELGAEVIELAISKSRCRELRNPWAAWQRAVDLLLEQDRQRAAGGNCHGA